jgi:hypothetical protein
MDRSIDRHGRKSDASTSGVSIVSIGERIASARAVGA